MNDVGRPTADVRREVLEVARQLLQRGLVEGTSGNVSARIDDQRVCITPSSVPYEEMSVDDLTVIDLEGEQLEGERHPSSEKALHLACYRAFPEVGAVIHAHPMYATMFAVSRQPIPAVLDEFSVYVGGEVPVCDYAQSGTPEVGEAAVARLKEVGAALLANHGLVALGTDPRKALHVAALVERAAQIVWGARLLGEVAAIPEEVNRNFASVYRWVRQNTQD